MCNERVDQVPDNVFHKSSRINSTWGGNLVDMVRCAKYLQIVDEDGLVDNAARQGVRLLAGLQDLASRYAFVSNPRGQGLFAAFSLSSSEQRDQLQTMMWESGLATLTSGPRSIRFRPSLTISSEEIDRVLELVDAGLSRLAG